MSSPFGTVQATLCPVIKDAIEAGIEGAVAEVEGSGGHYAIRVTSAAFAGKSPVQRQRLVYKTISHLMSGDHAGLHAVDRLETIVP